MLVIPLDYYYPFCLMVDPDIKFAMGNLEVAMGVVSHLSDNRALFITKRSRDIFGWLWIQFQFWFVNSLPEIFMLPGTQPPYLKSSLTLLNLPHMHIRFPSNFPRIRFQYNDIKSTNTIVPFIDYWNPYVPKETKRHNHRHLSQLSSLFPPRIISKMSYYNNGRPWMVEFMNVLYPHNHVHFRHLLMLILKPFSFFWLR